LDKILLPKKDEPSRDSAQRVNAGVLLQAEQSAELPKAPVPAPKPPQSPPAAQPPEKKASTGVAPLETYQGDIEGLVQSKNVSVLSIAAAEAARRGATSGGEAAAQSPSIDIKEWAKRGAMIAGGVVLLAAAAGAIAWIAQPPRMVEVADVATVPFIKIDASKSLAVPASGFTHRDFINALVGQRDAVSLSLGLMEGLVLGTASSTANGSALIPLSAGVLLKYLSPSVPDGLVRSINPSSYLFGIHSYDGNQPFLILRADSYEGAYAGMLAWERVMPAELQPLFVRTPPVLIRNEPTTPAPVATSTATTTQAASSTPVALPPAPTFAAPLTFTDRIVENHDARVIENADHQILLMWAFANRNVLVITTNDATFREVVSRLETPPIVPTP
jgi:hypothetical protein